MYFLEHQCNYLLCFIVINDIIITEYLELYILLNYTY